MSNVIYKNIYNNYISSLYLHILSIVKSKEVTIDIFKKTFQWLCDNSSYLDYDKLFITLRRYTSKLINNYCIDNEFISDENYHINECDMIVPNELICLSSQISSIFKDEDNAILCHYLVFNKPIKEIKTLLNLDENLIKERIIEILKYVKALLSSSVYEEEDAI